MKRQHTSEVVRGDARDMDDDRGFEQSSANASDARLSTSPLTLTFLGWLAAFLLIPRIRPILQLCYRNLGYSYLGTRKAESIVVAEDGD